MRLILVAAALAAAVLPAAAVQISPALDMNTGSRLVRTLGDEAVCGLPSFSRRRACYVAFGEFGAWIYFGPDARTVTSVTLSHRVEPRSAGNSAEYRWVTLDEQGRVTKTIQQRWQPYAETGLTSEQAAREMDDALAAFQRDGVHAKSERYCSTDGDFEDHMMGCCDGLREVRVSEDGYRCAGPEGPVAIEPQYPSTPPDAEKR